MQVMTYHFKLTVEKFELALSALEEMYRVPKKQIVTMSCRQRNIVEARRMLIYYLYNVVGVKHNHMHRYIEGINHATSIHHCKKLKELIDIYPSEQRLFNEFRERAGDFNDKLARLKVMDEQIAIMQCEIRDIIKNIKDA